MKTKILIILIVLINITLKAQSKFTVGIGLSNNTHFFQHKNKGLRNDIYKPAAVNLPGLNAFAEMKTGNLFDFRVNASLGIKRVAFVYKNRIREPRGRVKSSINHSLVFVDISFLSLINIPQSKLNWRPIVGFFVSLNEYTGLSQSTTSRSGGIVNQNIPSLELSVDSYPSTFYAGINLGTAFKFNIRERELEFQILSYLSPMSLFDSNFSGPENSPESIIQGKYHYISFGLNVPFRKKESKYSE